MEAEEILAKAQEKESLPAGWVVFPLLRKKVIESIIYWILGIIVGVTLLAFVVPVVIPYNYQRGLFAAIFTTLLLGIINFIAIGSIYLLVVDCIRLQLLHKHRIVITDTDFVKQEGQKKIHVPLKNIEYVTARGRAPVDRTPPPKEETDVKNIPSLGESLFSFLFGRSANAAARGKKRKRMRTPASLAFLDTRTKEEVVALNDVTYGDPFYIAAVLKQHVAAAKAVSEQEIKN